LVEDIDEELKEPLASELDSNDIAVNVILEPAVPDRRKITTNAFQCAEYWLSKGYKM
jgi:hypothetical protein